MVFKRKIRTSGSHCYVTSRYTVRKRDVKTKKWERLFLYETKCKKFTERNLSKIVFSHFFMRPLYTILSCFKNETVLVFQRDPSILSPFSKISSFPSRTSLVSILISRVNTSQNNEKDWNRSFQDEGFKSTVRPLK